MEVIYKDVKDKMDKTLIGLKSELSRLRTGRATPALLDGVKVEYYGSLTPINQVANVSVPDPKLIVIQPWDQSAIAAIEKAIIKSDLGLNPQSDGKIIRVPIPALTDERRKELVKLVKKFGEDSKVSVRNIRRQANETLKADEKSKKVSEDDSRKGQEQIQKHTDDYISQIDKILEAKEKEILGS
ncbi:MAG: ribosome recycling factor [Proteobacteria bacterium]|nr:ribosome recycling factor [Pseudomonadota bacterium]